MLDCLKVFENYIPPGHIEIAYALARIISLSVDKPQIILLNTRAILNLARPSWDTGAQEIRSKILISKPRFIEILENI